MSWQPISRAELDALIEQGLREADDDVLSAWASMRITPEKWTCSPWGDDGGGFWVIAIRDAVVTWYNDIEEGFNESPLIKRGVISNYYCNQDDFSQYLQRLPEAQKASSRSPLEHSSSIPSNLKCPGQVLKRQTTYWTVETEAGEHWRIHFLEKVEFSFVASSYSAPNLTDSHPLLTHYSEPWLEPYFLGTPKQPDALTSVAAAAVAKATGGWRCYEDYANPAAPLSGSYGLLMKAPQTVVDVVRAELAKSGVSESTIASARPVHAYRVLLFDKSFVIAEGFRFARLDS